MLKNRKGNIMTRYIISIAACLLFAGCASTTITEYDEQGNVVKVTESDESAFAIAAQSIKEKDNMLHASGWTVGVWM